MFSPIVKESLYQGTRSAAVVTGGVVGGSLGGTPGAAVGGIVGGALTDGVTTILTDEPRGYFEAIDDIVSDVQEGNVPVQGIVKTGVLLASDAVCGATAGGLVDLGASIYSAPVKSLPETVLKGFIAGATNPHVQTFCIASGARIFITENRKGFKSKRPSSTPHSGSSSGSAPSSSSSSSQNSNNSSAKANSSPGSSAGSSSGGGQPPKGNQNNRNKRGQHSVTPDYIAVFLNILSVDSLDDVTMGRPYINIFVGLVDGQIDTLKKLLKNLAADGYLEEVIRIVVCIFDELDVDDVSFQNFLSLANFVATFIGEYSAQREEANRNGSDVEPRQEAIIDIRQNIQSFARGILNLFNELRIDIEIENDQLIPPFRNIFSAVYHWYKHRQTPKGQYLSIKEYFQWIKKLLHKLKQREEYGDLMNPSHPTNVLVYEVFYTIFERKFKIVLKVQDGEVELSSAYAREVPTKDVEGDEFIGGKNITMRDLLEFVFRPNTSF